MKLTTKYRFTDAPRFDRKGIRLHSVGSGYRRALAEQNHEEAISKKGETSSASHAALGRLIGLIGESFPELYTDPVPESSEALDRALFRESGADGYLNRRMRKYHLRSGQRSTT